MSSFEQTSQSIQTPIDNSQYANAFNDDANYRNFAVLKLHVNPENAELVKLYTEHVNKHNAQLRESAFPNAGFDVFIPKRSVFTFPMETHFVDLEIKAEMIFVDLSMKAATDLMLPDPSSAEGTANGNHCGVCYTTGYYMYPRSSISKTPLMLANTTGIIDSGYRGNLIAAVRYLPVNREDNYVAEFGTRLFQICQPQLCPVYVVMVSENELSTTSRGSGGFGSTGVLGAIQTHK